MICDDLLIVYSRLHVAESLESEMRNYENSSLESVSHFVKLGNLVARVASVLVGDGHIVVVIKKPPVCRILRYHFIA